MTDTEYRDKALFAYIKAILDEPIDFPDEEIIAMFLENKIGTKMIIRDASHRIDRILREKLSDNLQ